MWLEQSIKLVSDILASKDACQAIYWDRWEDVKNKHLEIIKKHHKTHNTKWLLQSAIKIMSQEDMEANQILVFMWTCAYLNNEK